MFALDLFNTDHERRLAEGAVDRADQRRIDDLTMKMDNLVTRAKKATTLEEKAALVREFQKCKAELDECMGYGGLVGEGEVQQKGPRPEDIPAYLRKQQGRAPLTPQQVKAPSPGTISHPDVLKKNSGNSSELDEQDEEQAQQELGAGYGVYNELLKAWNEKRPFAKVPMPGGEFLTISRPHIFNVLYALKNMNDNTFKKTVANAFSSLDKFMIWSNSIKRYNLPAEKPQSPPGQMTLPGLKEAGQKKNPKDLDTPQSTEVQRYLTKVRRDNPNATSDVEAIAKDELAKQARVTKNLSNLEKVNAQQDAALKKSMALDREQDNEINDIESQVSRLAQRLQSIKAGKPSSSQPAQTVPNQPAVAPEPQTATPTDATTKEPGAPVSSTSIVQPIYIAEPEKLSQKDQKIYAQVKDLETELKSKIDSMATWDKVAQQDEKSRNELEQLRKDTERTNRELQRKIKALQKDGTVIQQSPQADPQASLDLGTTQSRNYIANLRKSLGHSLGDLQAQPVPSAREKDLNVLSPDQFNSMNLAREPVEEGKQRLYQGDPIVVTGPNEYEGKTGEIAEFSPSGKFVVVDLYNHGRHSMHLSDVAYNEYADKQEEDDWYDEMDEAVEDYASIYSPEAIALGKRFCDHYNITDDLDIQLAVEIIDSYLEEFKRKNVPVDLKQIRSGVADAFRYAHRGMGKGPSFRKKFQEQNAPAKPFRNPPGFNKQGTGVGNRLAQQTRDNNTNWTKDLSKDQLDALAGPRYPKRPKIQVKKNKGVTEAEGSWIVYDPETKQIRKRFKTHTAGKSYAKTHGLGFASSEFYFDRVKENAVAEVAPPGAKAERMVKHIKKSLSKDGKLSDKDKAIAYATTWKAHNAGKVEESPTDYQKRRQRERDVDAGRPVKPLPKNPQTDYARKRAKDRKDMELGEVSKGTIKNYVKANAADQIQRASSDSFKSGAKGDKYNKADVTHKDNMRQQGMDRALNRLGEDSTTGSEAVERAILNRIMVAHTDLLMKFGPEKVMQAAEEVAYNVGDVDEIGTSDVSAYVAQVKQILGVPMELDEKWSQKYKSSINCSNPKGFSQKAHCAGKKK
jgi:hypothetical protein